MPSPADRTPTQLAAAFDVLRRDAVAYLLRFPLTTVVHGGRATQVDRDKKHVTIDVTVKSPDVLAVLKKGARLPLGLYRMEGKTPRQFLAWSPTRTPKPDFHVPSMFGTLILD